MTEVATPPVAEATAPVAAPAPAAAPAPIAAPAPAPAAEAPPASVLTEPDKPFTWDDVDKKFQVKNDKGELDKDATAAKLAKSYAEIQKRASRGGEARPAAISDYAINVPEEMKAVITAEAPEMKGLLSKAYAAGVTQAQLDVFMEAYATAAPALVKGAAAADGAAAASALRKIWPNDGDFDKNIGYADRAVEQLSGNDPRLVAAVRDNPVLIEYFAKVGAQLGEDRPPTGMHGGAAVDINALRSSEAYNDASHRDHQKVSKQVNDLVAAQMRKAGVPNVAL